MRVDEVFENFSETIKKNFMNKKPRDKEIPQSYSQKKKDKKNNKENLFPFTGRNGDKI